MRSASSAPGDCSLDSGAKEQYGPDWDWLVNGPEGAPYGGCMLGLVLVALSLGLSNFAAAIGIRVSGIDARTRLRVGVIFGLFETAMPILGLLLGRSLANTLGHAAHWIGAALLIATGLYAVIQAVRSQDQDPVTPAGQRTGAAADHRTSGKAV
jgi:hypothetical protein